MSRIQHFIFAILGLLTGLFGFSIAQAQTSPLDDRPQAPSEEVLTPRVSTEKYTALAVDTAWLKTLTPLQAAEKAAGTVDRWSLRDVSASPASKFAVERNYYLGYRSRDNLNRELWITEAAGKEAKRVANDPRSLIGSVVWSPNGKYLAYVEEKMGRLFVVDAKSLRKTLIAERTWAPFGVLESLGAGADAPRWTSDSLALLFWQEKEAGKAQWQAYRATNLSQQPKRELASDLVTKQPGVFRPHGQYLAALSSTGTGIIIETLSTHRRSEYYPPLDRVTAIKWSPDSQWLYMKAESAFTEYGFGATYALNLSTGKRIVIDRSLGAIAIAEATSEEATSEYVAVRTAEWLPGTGHRLLVFATNATHIVVGIGPPAVTKPETKFLVYDVDTNTTFEIESVLNDKLNDKVGFHRAPDILRTSDDSSLLINGNSPCKK